VTQECLLNDIEQKNWG